MTNIHGTVIYLCYHFDLQRLHTNPAVLLFIQNYARFPRMMETKRNKITFVNFLQHFPLQTKFNPKFPAKFHQTISSARIASNYADTSPNGPPQDSQIAAAFLFSSPSVKLTGF